MKLNRKFEILLIDDEKEYCELVKKAYVNIFDLTCVYDANSALDRIRKQKFDLILLDLFLDGNNPDGFNLHKKIKKIRPRIPILAVTKDETKEVIYDAFATHKIDDIIFKNEISFEDWVPRITKAITDNPIRSVFFSYSWEDKAFANFLVKHLEFNNIQVLIDEENIQVKDRFSSKIPELLEKSDFYLIILSTNSVFQSDWVKRELNYVLNDSDFGYQCIIPVQLGNFRLPRDYKLDIGGQKILVFPGQEELNIYKSKLSFIQWLELFPNPFEELVNSYNEKIDEIVTAIYDGDNGKIRLRRNSR